MDHQNTPIDYIIIESEFPLLLSTPQSNEEAVQIQLGALKKYSSELKMPQEDHELRFVAGVDLSFPKTSNPTWAIAGAVIYDLKVHEIVEVSTVKERLQFAYTPGLLGFREVPAMLRALAGLSIIPEVVLCDGHGRLHPRYFGEAVHLGICLSGYGIPTIGVAKNPFYCSGPWDQMPRLAGEKAPLQVTQNHASLSHSVDIIKLLHGNGGIQGYAMCMNDGMKPVFVSPGVAITVMGAVDLTWRCRGPHRLPEPLYHADHASRNSINALDFV
jgi:deoxyribonuclease V